MGFYHISTVTIQIWRLSPSSTARNTLVSSLTPVSHAMIRCEDVCCFIIMLKKLFHHFLKFLDSCINNSYILLVLSISKQNKKKKHGNETFKSYILQISVTVINVLSRNITERVPLGKLSVDCLLLPTATLWMAKWTMLTQ